MQTPTSTETRNITLTLTPAQVTQLLTAVHVRSLQAERVANSPRASECTFENQANLRWQSQIADQLVLLVEQALR